MVEHVQSMAAKEASAVGVDWTFAPMVDIARDPRWGRIMEGAGKIRISAQKWRPPRSAAFRAMSSARRIIFSRA